MQHTSEGLADISWRIVEGLKKLEVFD